MLRIGWKRRPERGGRLRPISAWALLQAREEALCMAASQESFGICLNACVISRALLRRGRPVYESGEALLRGMTEPQLRSLTEDYLARFTDCAQTPAAVNPNFDAARFEELRGQ